MRYGIFLALYATTLLSAAPDVVRLAAVDATQAPRVFAVVDQSSPNKELAAAEFVLRTDGKSSSAAKATPKFRDTDLSVALIVALDASGSMRGRPMDAIRQGLAGLVSKKRERDRVAVLSFANDLRWESRWDADAASLEDAFQKLTTRGSQTRLYDAIGIALDEFTAQEGLPARRSLLIISDGHDEGSKATLADLSRRLRESRVRLDAAGLANSPSWFSTLRELTKAGFGEFHAASGPDSLKKIVTQGIERLLDMPVLEFAAEDLAKDGKVHRLGVQHQATSWRDDIRVTVPEAPWWRRTQVLIGATILLLSMIGVVIFIRYRPRQISVAQSRPRPPAPAPRTREQSGPLLETAQNSPPPAVVRSPTEWSPTEYEPIAPSPPRPAQKIIVPRQETVLATPGGTGQGAPTSMQIVSGPYAGQRVALSENEFWIGSRVGNHLCLSADLGVTGNHACIRREGTALRLYDHGSLNGTWVNGRQIGEQATMLRPGDQVRIGATELRLEL